MGKPLYMSCSLYSSSGPQLWPYHPQLIWAVFHRTLWPLLDRHVHSIRIVHMYPHLFHCAASSVPDDMSCMEPVLQAFTHAPHCLHSLVLMLGTFSRIGSESVVSILIASYGQASLHITHPTHLSSISI